MSPTFYHVLHVVSVLVLTGYTFYAFAAPAESRKKVMIITGISSLLVLIGGFGLQAKLAVGWPGWAARVAVNVAGGFAIGCLFARLSSHDSRGVPTGVPAAHRLREHRWGAGFLGGFTTVSGFAWDAAHAAGEGQGGALAAVLAANAIAGIAACAAGHALAVRPYAPPHE